MTRARLISAAAVLVLAAAAVLVVFALDMLHWDRALAAQDVRFLASPSQSRFSEPPTLLPFGATENALGAGDDLAFRRQLQGYARVRPRAAVVDVQRVQTLRAETQLGLARLSRTDPDSARRSRAANMIGVLALDERLAPRDPEALADLIRGAIGSFRNAVEIDPSNSDAKLNLEQALRIAKAASIGGDAPSGGRNTGERAGLGQAGSGY
ncbi:MAG: hypothetical protein H0V45_03900 [Actinobacteria bacterium]|nr:hypothetical protein [Actinomycetota bacterium]